MQRSEQINELATALAKAQAQMKPAPKDSVNPHFKNKYSDLAAVMEAIRDPLSSNGLALIQLPSTSNGDVTVVSMLMHSSGQWIADPGLTMTPQQKTPQGIGSCITYGRRYGAMAITGLSSDDDDGEAASSPRGSHPTPVPFKGPPANIGDGPEVYTATPQQRAKLRPIAKEFGVTDGNGLFALSQDLVRRAPEMESLRDAVRELVEETRSRA